MQAASYRPGGCWRPALEGSQDLTRVALRSLCSCCQGERQIHSRLLVYHLFARVRATQHSAASQVEAACSVTRKHAPPSVPGSALVALLCQTNPGIVTVQCALSRQAVKAALDRLPAQSALNCHYTRISNLIGNAACAGRRVCKPRLPGQPRRCVSAGHLYEPG